MLRPVRMTKIKIVGPKTQRVKVVETLHALKLMHLLDHKKTEALDIGTPEATAEEIAKTLVKIRSLLSAIPRQVPALHEKKETKTTFHDIQQTVDTTEAEFSAFEEKKKHIDKAREQKNEHITTLEVFDALGLSPHIIKEYKTVRLFIGTIETAHFQLFEHEIQKEIKERELLTVIQGKKTLFAFLVHKKQEEIAVRILEKFKYTPVLFMANEYSDSGSVKELFHKERTSLKLLEKDAEILSTARKKWEFQWREVIVASERWLAKEAEKAEAPVRFAETKYTFFIEGWVSAKEYQNLKKDLEKSADQRVHLEVLEIKKTDKIPIILKNMFFVRPFEFFLHLYTLPNYKEMDPSFFLFFGFPFFFGLMLGDVGYGIVTFLLFALLWLTMKKARNVLTAMMLCAIVSIFFGAIFGEYFGFEHVSEETGKILAEQYGLPLHKELLENGETIYSFPRLMNRLHGEMEIAGTILPAILVLGALFGFIHVNLGLFLGCINEVVSHGILHALYVKISWYILELGLVWILLSYLDLLQFHWGIGAALIVLAAGMLWKGEGIQGIVELPTILTNILSYLRLGAVGLSSVGLAVVINENLVLPFLEKGGIFVAVAILIFILGHMINIALGILGPFLHALRLHYVEFFSKFYKGGGISFVAFGEEKEEY